MLGSDPALWPAGERREGELIMHDKGYYHSYLGRSRKESDTMKREGKVGRVSYRTISRMSS